MKETAQALYESAENLGLLFTLHTLGFPLKVRVPLTHVFCEKSIDELQLSVRSRNGLMRSGALTIGGICDIIMSEEGLAKVRNLGKKSICEIKTSVLVYGYEELGEAEKMEFWRCFSRQNDLPEQVKLGGEQEC